MKYQYHAVLQGLRLACILLVDIAVGLHTFGHRTSESHIEQGDGDEDGYVSRIWTERHTENVETNRISIVLHCREIAGS